VAQVLQNYPIEAIYSSPYRRARETVAPLAARLKLSVYVEPLLQERRLGATPGMDFLEAVEATWRDPSFAHPGGESNAAAQQRGMTVVRRVQEQAVAEHVVLSSHGNLVALILQQFDPEIGFDFWRALTLPDIYRAQAHSDGGITVDHLWVESSGE
jgi:2,3-bisphosphoglycerate-dependent phosphoglycerate mutase